MLTSFSRYESSRLCSASDAFLQRFPQDIFPDIRIKPAENVSAATRTLLNISSSPKALIKAGEK